jgi:hypothetical protein
MSRGTFSLDVIKVASPCTAAWEDMAGTDEARFCTDCHKHVYNLSAMSRRRAEELILQKEGRLCVRFYRRHDGTMLTQDCPVGLRAIRRRLAWIGGIAAGFLFLILGGTATLLAANRGDRGGGEGRGPFFSLVEMLRSFIAPPLEQGGICPPPDLAPAPPIQIQPQGPGDN